METKYEKPTLDSKFEVIYNSPILKVVDCAEDLKYIKEGILSITDKANDFLVGYRLPGDVQGFALFTFKGYNARASNLSYFWFKNVGVVGFPTISIHTDLGTSHLSLRPKDAPKMEPTSHIQIDVYGRGLADILTQNILSQCNSVFNKKISSHNKPIRIEEDSVLSKKESPYSKPIRTEEFRDNPTPPYANKRIFIPLNL